MYVYSCVCIYTLCVRVLRLWREWRGGESGGVERVEGWREWRGGESGGAIDMHVLRVYVLCRFGVI